MKLFCVKLKTVMRLNKWSLSNVCLFLNQPVGSFRKLSNFEHILSTMEDMVGKWKLEKRDPNFEEFLICRQVTSHLLIIEGKRSKAWGSTRAEDDFSDMSLGVNGISVSIS